MSDWYCAINGQKYGPVDEQGVCEWISQGRVKAADYVWTAGMTDWVEAGKVFASYFDAKGASYPTLSMVPIGAGAGSGGRTPNREITAKARKRLQGNWGIAIGAVLLVGIIQMGVQMFPYIGGLARLFIDGALTLGQVIFFLCLVRRGKLEIGLLFKGFNTYGRALGAYLLVALFVMLWTTLAMIPAGIVFGIAAYMYNGDHVTGVALIFAGSILAGLGFCVTVWAQLRYAMTFYILADDKTVASLDAISRSIKMMDGKKNKLIFLQMRFIGWALLCILTLFIGFIFLIPYIITSSAIFYEDLRITPVGNFAAPEMPAEPPAMQRD